LKIVESQAHTDTVWHPNFRA